MKTRGPNCESSCLKSRIFGKFLPQRGHRPGKLPIIPFSRLFDCYAGNAMMRTTLWLKRAATSAIICCTCALSACNARRWSRIVLYDQLWSRAAAIENLKCAAEVRDDCRKEAVADVVSFTSNLSSAFQSSPECKDTQFVVVPADTSPSLQANADLSRLRVAPHWRLHVDYHPRLTAQSFRLDLVGGGFIDRSNIAGESTATRMAGFACEISRSNGDLRHW